MDGKKMSQRRHRHFRLFHPRLVKPRRCDRLFTAGDDRGEKIASSCNYNNTRRRQEYMSHVFPGRDSCFLGPLGARGDDDHCLSWWNKSSWHVLEKHKFMACLKNKHFLGISKNFGNAMKILEKLLYLLVFARVLIVDKGARQKGLVGHWQDKVTTSLEEHWRVLKGRERWKWK